MQLKYLENRKNKVFFTVIILLLILCSYFIYISTEYKKQNQQFVIDRNDLKIKLDELNKKYTEIVNQLEISQADKTMLTQSFDQVGSQYNSLMQEYTVKSVEVDKLQKTVQIDDELLKKYSKYYFLNENYVPASTTLVDINLTLNNKNILILSEVKSKLENMINAAKTQSVNIIVYSGYRSFKEQLSLKSAYTQKFGLSKSNQFSADQGYSEHQLGTAVDVSDGKTGLSTGFEKTASFIWLQDNAYKYGFILSYPKNNSYYQYEPWHYRYVGVELATYLKTNDLNFYDLDQKIIDAYKIKIFE